MCDEVYEHLIFSGSQHISLRSLPDMQQRSIRIGSAGKTFSFTAWKVGCNAGLTARCPEECLCCMHASAFVHGAEG